MTLPWHTGKAAGTVQGSVIARGLRDAGMNQQSAEDCGNRETVLFVPAILDT